MKNSAAKADKPRMPFVALIAAAATNTATRLR
jgi:hypothetical protein